MAVIYNVSIESTGTTNRFLVTWKNQETGQTDSFEETIDMSREETKWLWQMPRHRLIIGNKLFIFLDGKDHLFEQALEQAKLKGDSLVINLITSREIEDWPFEILAKDTTFLLPQELHLVRSFSDFSEQKLLPANRPLKLLFMASSPIDVKKELDFEKEEAAFFQVTGDLALDLDVEDSGSLEGLGTLLEKNRYDVIHLSGRAGRDEAGSPFFVMENDTGGEHRVSPEELWQKALKRNPPHLLVVAEHSFASQLERKFNIPMVLAWGRKMDDRQAVFAGQTLYRELSRGFSVVHAVWRTRYELMTHYSHNDKPAWPLLRLYAAGIPSQGMVTKEQHNRPKPRRMTHIYLRKSRVQILKEGFVGRRRQLQRSFLGLTIDPHKVGLLILGTGGLGKSCLAGKICERFSEHTLIIVQGKFNTITLESALKDAFIISQDDNGRKILSHPIPMKDKISHLCSTRFKERKYLFLLDDFEQNLEGFERGEPGELFPEAAELLRVLLHYLPYSGKNSQLIITSRYDFTLLQQEHDLVEKRLAKIWLTGFNKTEQRKKGRELKNIFTLENQEIARQFLSAGLGNPRLMEWLDILLGQVDTQEAEQLASAMTSKQEEFIQKHVIRELLKKGGASLERFLRWFSIYRIPVEEEGVSLVAKEARLKNWKKLLRKGMALSLAEHDQARQSYQVTPLLRTDLLKGLKDPLPCHQAAFTYFEKICEAQEPLDPILTEEWIYHALACGQEDVASKIGYTLVVHLRTHLAYRESRRVGEWILKEKKRELSTSYDTFLLNAIASVLHYLADYKQAIVITKRALPVDRLLCGNRHLKIAIDLNDLGEAWRALGYREKAAILYHKALGICQLDSGDEHPLMAGILNNLGELYRERDQLQEAIKYHEGALAIDQTKLGENHPDVIRDLNNLGLNYLALAQYQQSIKYFQMAFCREQELYGEVHPRTADTINNLASISTELGQFDKAVDYCQLSLSIVQRLYGEFHPSVSIRLNNLGTLWKELGDYHKAIDCYNQALKIECQVYGEKHPNVALLLNNLGEVWRALGENGTAIELFQQALDINQTSYGDKHSSVAKNFTNLGAARHDMGDLLRAIEYYEKALIIDRFLFGKEHPDVADSYNNLGEACRELGEFEKAFEYYHNALAIWEKFYPEKHPKIAIVLNNLGLMWMALGECNKAVNYFKQALDILNTCYGTDHPDLSTPLINLGSLYVQMKQLKEASEYLEKAHKLCIKFYGPNHPRTKEAMGWLDDCH